MPPSKSLAEAIVRFSSRSDIAPATRTFYRDSLNRIFLPWAEARGVADIDEVGQDVVEAFAIHLQDVQSRRGGPLSTATRQTYLRAVRQLLSWLQQRGELAERVKVPMPRSRRQHRDTLTEQEIDRLEQAAPIERDKLIVRVMAVTGAREGEVASIRTTDLLQRDRRYCFVRVRGKTGERVVPIPAELYRRLDAYGRGHSGRPQTRSEFLFMAHRRRNRGDYEPLTADGIYQVVADVAARADLGKRIYPHLFRHSLITRLVAQGVNIVTVSELVGVSVAVIAEHYSHQSDEQRWEAMRRLWES